MPGLAVDSATRTAYVAAPSGLVAEVALAGPSVRYHALRGTLAKYRAGAERHAVSLGSGVLAVAGTNSAVESANGDPVQSTRASGLELIDTRGGVTRSIDAEASSVLKWHGGLVSAGRSWDSRVSAQRGSGLAIFDRSGVLRTRLLPGRPASLMGVHGDLAYAYVDSDRVTIDLAAGRIVSRGAGGAFPLLR
jgi:hypothetical protein